jgi:hypothetical protein
MVSFASRYVYLSPVLDGNINSLPQEFARSAFDHSCMRENDCRAAMTSMHVHVADTAPILIIFFVFLFVFLSTRGRGFNASIPARVVSW